ncbi:paraquat-inducible protein A [Pedobacter sp. MR2016-19]|uniref:paraquat-inducible protein A n=1 Tax=Pedobacter sp. MR2016-19 TaxID=2780089 RepID=UPI0018765A10|nr:paraquat-inducible protein A [Pedobacter sp. MR2016-19]MBE5319174.1 paraquat-inducible protein A [Pedobacter sp. MR2016-19]
MSELQKDNISTHNQVKPGRSGSASFILIAALSLLLVAAAYCGYRFRALAYEQKHIKEDYSLSNNITFGIFSVDRWGDKISAVVDRRVKGFNLTKSQKADMQQEVEKQLHGMVNKAVAEFTRPQKGLGAKLKKLAFNTFVDVKEIHAMVPSFSRTIVTKVTSPKSLKKLKSVAVGKLDELEAQTYDLSDQTISSVEHNIYQKYKVNNAAAFDRAVNSKLKQIKELSYQYAIGMTACIIIALLLWLMLRKRVNSEVTLFVISLLFAFILLAVGVSSPIIEVDARIHTLEFALLGEKLVFTNQVLFFQSQSILGIIGTLVEQPKPDAVLVGVLLMLFVVILPLLRLIARGLQVSCTELLGNSKFIRFLAFDLGKWDMADVMVVGIAMTYIGLNGILKSQLSGLNINTEALKVVTVNNSALQLGFFIFVAYVAYNIILSSILKRIDEQNGPCN